MNVNESNSTSIVNGHAKNLRAGRRPRKWSVNDKRRIVEETFVPGASVSIVARRHDVNANLLFDWRRQYRKGTLTERKAAEPQFIRIGVIEPDGSLRPLPVSEDPPAASASQPRSACIYAETAQREAPAMPESVKTGITEIELPNRIKVRFDAGIDEATLRRVLSMAKEIAC